LALLIGGTLALWGVAAYPAYLLWGEPAVVFSAAAALLCLIPTTATLVWCHKAFQSSPEQQLLAVMGGTVVRLVVVIGAGMALYFSAPYFHRGSFWVWVVVFYLVTLTVEIGLIVARQAAADRPQNY
jgi:hypothetical protein